MEFAGRYVNPAHIVQVIVGPPGAPNKRGASIHRVRMELVGTEGILYEEQYGPEWSEAHVLEPKVAASPGYYVLQFHELPSDEWCGYSKIPVVAWNIDQWNTATPVCSEQILATCKALLYPDGSVYDYWEDRSHDSLSGWQEAMNAAFKAQQEKLRLEREAAAVPSAQES